MRSKFGFVKGVWLFSSFAFSVFAGGLGTVQNSSLSVPASDIARGGVQGATNLAGSNFMLSAVVSNTAQRGYATLHNSERWVRRYRNGTSSFQDGPYAMVVRTDGSIVMSDVTSTSFGSYDFVTLDTD